MRDVSKVSVAVRLFSLGLATSWSATAAYAVCGTPAVGGGGSGPPSISVAEASTTQVLEQIRKRQQAAQEQPMLVADSTEAEAAPAPPPPAEEPPAQSSSSSSGSAASSSAAASSGSSSSGSGSAAASSGGGGGGSSGYKPAKTYSSGGGSLKDTPIEYSAGPSRTRGTWAQGFYDYEKHDDLAPGNQENPDRRSHTAGVVSGMDWTVAKANSAYQFGIFSGYSNTKSDFSDTTFNTDDTDAPPGNNNEQYLRSNNEQDVDGPFIGAYAASVNGNWTHDVALKVDFFDLESSSTLTQLCGNFANGNDGVLSDIGQQSGSADMTTFTLALGTQYRHQLTANTWLAPAAGFRYTHTDFSNDRSNTVFTDERLPGAGPGSPGTSTPGTLGLDDGYSIRLQAGLRYGEERTTSQGYLWTTTLGAFLYSDVLVEGFTGIAGQTGEVVSPVDEGEVRVLGQLTSNLEVGNGLSYQFVGEVRGGEDLFGIGGQVGIRYEW